MDRGNWCNAAVDILSLNLNGGEERHRDDAEEDPRDEKHTTGHASAPIFHNPMMVPVRDAGSTTAPVVTSKRPGQHAILRGNRPVMPGLRSGPRTSMVTFRGGLRAQYLAAVGPCGLAADPS